MKISRLSDFCLGFNLWISKQIKNGAIGCAVISIIARSHSRLLHIPTVCCFLLSKFHCLFRSRDFGPAAGFRRQKLKKKIIIIIIHCYVKVHILGPQQASGDTSLPASRVPIEVLAAAHKHLSGQPPRVLKKDW